MGSVQSFFFPTAVRSQRWFSSGRWVTADSRRPARFVEDARGTHELGRSSNVVRRRWRVCNLSMRQGLLSNRAKECAAERILCVTRVLSPSARGLSARLPACRVIENRRHFVSHPRCTASCTTASRASGRRHLSARGSEPAKSYLRSQPSFTVLCYICIYRNVFAHSRGKTLARLTPRGLECCQIINI